jgi:hypothetical protein
MRIGTKSLLFGYHCFFIHPFFVAYAWYKLYGFPKHPLLWLCFFVHDIGYYNMLDMDSDESEKHPELGAKIVRIFGGIKWYYFCLCHSRFYAKKLNLNYSKLCVADKAVIYLMPQKLSILLYKLTGEYKEYIERSFNGKYEQMNVADTDIIKWDNNVRSYTKKWVNEHKELKQDIWTKI